MKVNKISFPKGSLKFKKIPIKEGQKPNFKELKSRKFLNGMFEMYFPHEKKNHLPAEFHEVVSNNIGYIRQSRQLMSKINNSTIVNNYEITFTPSRKWLKLFELYTGAGLIIVKSERKTLRDSLKLISETFKEKKNQVRKMRFREKTANINTYGNSTIRYMVSGGCIFMPEVKEGVFLKFLKAEERKIVYGDKIPKETDAKYVGIEMEFLCPLDKETLGAMLFDKGLGRHITLKEDHSIKCSHGANPYECREHVGKEHAHELCIIAKEGEYEEVVAKVCKLLAEIKATVNKTCGMHVHLDCRSRDPEKVYQNLISSQNILLRMNPKSRIETYAKFNKERDFERAKSLSGAGDGGRRIDEGRYYAINAKAYDKHKTIEVRVHAGTVDLKKITSWLKVLVGIASCKERYVRSFATINTFCTRFGIDETVQTYIQERIDKFKIKVEGGMEIAPEAERGVA